MQANMHAVPGTHSCINMVFECVVGVYKAWVRDWAHAALVGRGDSSVLGVGHLQATCITSYQDIYILESFLGCH
jgi:hypothetical protein